MTTGYELIKKEVLKTEKALFVGRLFFVLAGYIGITLWLNAIRQNAASWLLWILIVLQLFFFFSIFVTCLMRSKQCGYQHGFWAFLVLAIASRVNDWELVIIPAMAIVMLVLSGLNQKVSPERQHLLPEEDDHDENAVTDKSNNLIQENKPDSTDWIEARLQQIKVRLSQSITEKERKDLREELASFKSVLKARDDDLEVGVEKIRLELEEDLSTYNMNKNERSVLPSFHAWLMFDNNGDINRSEAIALYTEYLEKRYKAERAEIFIKNAKKQS